MTSNFDLRYYETFALALLKQLAVTADAEEKWKPAWGPE
jgi:hypothetical protein